MPGPLGSTRPGDDNNLTGGPSTSTFREFQQVDRETRRSVHSDRPQRAGIFGVNTSSPMAKNVDQKSPGLKNLRAKGVFKRKRLRK